MKKSLMGIGDLFGKTWEIYKKHFLKLMIIGAICFGLTYMALTVGAGLAGLSILPAVALGSGELAIGLGLGWFMIIFIAAIVISTLGQAALIFAAKESSRKWKVGDVFKKGWSKLLSLLWVNFLIGLIVGLGFILLVVPGIIFAVWFTFSIYAVICEDKRGFKALFRSKELVKGHWWSLFGRAILLIIIYMILSAILRSWAPVLLSILFTPFSVIYYYVIYKDLKGPKVEKRMPGGFQSS